MTDPDVPLLADSARLSGPALRAFDRLADLWKLSAPEQLVLLGSPARSSYFRWKKDPDNARLSQDTLERLSYLVAIHEALEALLPDAQTADAWLRKPNDAPPFGGRSALARMLSGLVADLYVVRLYVGAQAAGAGRAP